MPHAALHYYTGTGNTRRAVDIIAETLAAAGWTAESREMRHAEAPAREPPAVGAAPPDLTLVAFPALGFSAPAPALRWMGRLSRAAGANAAVLCVCGSTWSKAVVNPGWSGSAVFKAAARLRGRGYKAAWTAEISYPENWTQLVQPPPADRLAEMVAAGDAAVRAFGQALAAGERARIPASAGRAAVAPVGFLLRHFARRVLACIYAADARCTGCGRCARACPSGAIAIAAGRPRWTGACSGCNRCINLCPFIQTSWLKLFVHATLNLAAAIAVWPLAGRLAPGLGLAPAAASLLAPILAVAGYCLFTLFQAGPADRFLAFLARRPQLAAAFEAGPTRSWRRYLAPGFRPEE